MYHCCIRVTALLEYFGWTLGKHQRAKDVRPVRRIFKRGVLLEAVDNLSCGSLGAQPPAADEGVIIDIL